MWRQAIPDEDESSFMFVFLFHIIKHPENCFRIDATMLHPCQVTSLLYLWVPSDHAKKRKVLPPSGGYCNRCHTFLAPSGPNRWLVGHALFVEKTKGCFVFQTPFLTAGHAVLIHVVIAFSSRSRALLSGF